MLSHGTSFFRLSFLGVFVAVSAGNNNHASCNNSPASASSAVTVASTTNTDSRSGFSVRILASIERRLVGSFHHASRLLFDVQFVAFQIDRILDFAVRTWLAIGMETRIRSEQAHGIYEIIFCSRYFRTR